MPSPGQYSAITPAHGQPIPACYLPSQTPPTPATPFLGSKITLFGLELLEEAEEYFLALNDKMKVKFLKAFDKTKSGLKGPWFEKLQTKEGIFEFREKDQD